MKLDDSFSHTLPNSFLEIWFPVFRSTFDRTLRLFLYRNEMHHLPFVVYASLFLFQ